MNPTDGIPAWAAVPVALLLVLGGSLSLIGALGLVRLSSFYQRIHGPAVTATLGATSILIASAMYFTALQQRLVVHEIVIAAFVLMTAPVVAMLLIRAAVYRDLEREQAGSTEGPGQVYRAKSQWTDEDPSSG
jgi:multicomponent K+:H+ antiporter subunit G